MPVNMTLRNEHPLNTAERYHNIPMQVPRSRVIGSESNRCVAALRACIDRVSTDGIDEIIRLALCTSDHRE